MSWPLIAVFGDDDRDDDVAGCHADCADGEDGFAAYAVDVEDRRDGGEEHDDADDAGGEEGDGVGGEAEGGEDRGRVVQDGVDAGPLLEEPSGLLSADLDLDGRGKERKKEQTHIVTVATMTRLNIALVRNKLPIATNCNFAIFTTVNSLKCGQCSATVLFSNNDCALISRNSSSTNS